jgi:NitT/TauT family transport system permease protein
LRQPIPKWQSIALGIVCVLVCLGGWWLVTWGPNAERIVSPVILPSPKETFEGMHYLWFEGQLTRNTLATLRRVSQGFGLAVLFGIPIGILAGCFPRVNAFLTPLIMFGRNIPIAALVPLVALTIGKLKFEFWYSATEWQKIAFIFIATVAFVIADTAQAVRNVAERYVDTAYTLGASRWNTISKVLVPLAMPDIFSSCRLMFGIAFGYIMLAESMREQDTAAGLGYLITMAQRRNYTEQVYLIILIIPMIALLIDQILYWMQRSLFPYQYPSDGLLHHTVRAVLHGWDDLKRMIFGSKVSDDFLTRHYPAVQAADVKAATESTKIKKPEAKP